MSWEKADGRLPNEPDDGHTHDYQDVGDLPDTGTDATTLICVLCGELTTEHANED